MEEQKRHSGFETMRILSMVMIVLMHGIGHGGLGSAAPQGSAAFWIYWLLFILARVSTNCFVMLSGYYLSERKGAVRAGRLFRIGAQVWFYSMLTFCVAVKAGAVPLSAISLLRALLPLTSNGYWFASAYFLMYLSVPVLNTVVQSLDRRQYKTLLLVALLLQSVWGTLFYWATDVTFVNNGYSFIWFYTLYFMAAYFRKYRVTVPSGLCLLAYLAASAAGLFNRMLALRVENALHLNGFVNTVNGYQALATVIAQAVSGIGLCFYSLYRFPDFRVSRQNMQLKWATVKEIATYSSLTCAQQSVMNFGILMVQGLINSFGTAVMAGFAAAVKIDSFAYMPVQDFGNAFSTFIAQNFGAGKHERIRKGIRVAVRVTLIFCLIISVLVFVLARPLMLIFIPAHETEIISIGVEYLRIEGAFYCGIGWLFLLYGFYRAVRKPGMSVVLTVISLGVRVALAYTLAAIPGIGVWGIWWSIPIGWFLADIFGWCYYRMKQRKSLEW